MDDDSLDVMRPYRTRHETALSGNGSKVLVERDPNEIQALLIGRDNRLNSFASHRTSAISSVRISLAGPIHRLNPNHGNSTSCMKQLVHSVGTAGRRQEWKQERTGQGRARLIGTQYIINVGHYIGTTISAALLLLLLILRFDLLPH